MRREDLIHIRESADDAIMRPKLCGLEGGASVTSAWGYWGPGGDGFVGMCPECVLVEQRRRGQRVVTPGGKTARLLEE